MTEKSHRGQPTLRGAIAAQIRDEIVRGELDGGARLLQAEVAERLGTSTTPVREAFTQLIQEGFLIAGPHRGAIVFIPTAADLQEGFEMRIALEALAARLAIADLGEAAVARMAEILDEIDRLGDDPDGYVRLNAEFHDSLYAPCRRPRLLEQIRRLRTNTGIYLRFLGATDRSQSAGHEEHRAILAAAAAGDPDLAGAAVAYHLEQRLASFRGVLARKRR